MINQIRLDINCSAACNGCYIDSVKLIGYRSHRECSLKELRRDLQQLVTNDYFPDVIFEFDDGQTTKSYRNLLRTRSIYFNELFAKNSVDPQKSIRIHRITCQCFEQILRFILSDTLEPTIDYKICLELMCRAEEFSVSSMYDEALVILKDQLNLTNVLSIFMFNDNAEMCLDDVVHLCIDFIEKNRRDIYHPDQMKLLTKAMLMKLTELVS